MQKPETKFLEKVKKELKNLPNTWFVKTQMVAVRGIPDLLICCRGIFYALELKKDEASKATPLQLHTLEQIELAGGISGVVSPENWPLWYIRLKRMAEKGRHYD